MDAEREKLRKERIDQLFKKVDSDTQELMWHMLQSHIDSSNGILGEKIGKVNEKISELDAKVVKVDKKIDQHDLIYSSLTDISKLTEYIPALIEIVKNNEKEKIVQQDHYEIGKKVMVVFSFFAALGLFSSQIANCIKWVLAHIRL